MVKLKVKLVRRAEGYAFAIDKGLINAGIIDPEQKEYEIYLDENGEIESLKLAVKNILKKSGNEIPESPPAGI